MRSVTSKTDRLWIARQYNSKSPGIYFKTKKESPYFRRRIRKAPVSPFKQKNKQTNTTDWALDVNNANFSSPKENEST